MTACPCGVPGCSSPGPDYLDTAPVYVHRHGPEPVVEAGILYLPPALAHLEAEVREALNNPKPVFWTPPEVRVGIPPQRQPGGRHRGTPDPWDAPQVFGADQ